MLYLSGERLLRPRDLDETENRRKDQREDRGKRAGHLDVAGAGGIGRRGLIAQRIGEPLSRASSLVCAAAAAENGLDHTQR